jgi:hypothetical protein
MKLLFVSIKTWAIFILLLYIICFCGWWKTSSLPSLLLPSLLRRRRRRCRKVEFFTMIHKSSNFLHRTFCVNIYIQQCMFVCAYTIYSHRACVCECVREIFFIILHSFPHLHNNVKNNNGVIVLVRVWFSYGRINQSAFIKKLFATPTFLHSFSYTQTLALRHAMQYENMKNIAHNSMSSDLVFSVSFRLRTRSQLRLFRCAHFTHSLSIK